MAIIPETSPRNTFHMPAFTGGTPMQEGEYDKLLLESVEDLCTYHPWTKDSQKKAGEEVAAGIKVALFAIVKHIPPSPNRTLAVQHLVDARMRANAAITFEGRY